MEEVNNKIDCVIPEVKEVVDGLINDTYEKCYNGMVEGVKKSATAEALQEEFKAVKAVRPEVIKAAVQNPIPKLRLTPTLERNRKSVIHEIKREIGVGLSQGDRMSTMARRLSDRVNINYRQSMLIARTEAHRVRETGLNDAANEVDEVLKANGSEYRKIKIWNTCEDASVRDTHAKMNGVAVLQDEKFELPSGATADCPGTSGVASEDCNCRCFLTHDIVTDAEFYELTGRHFPDYKKNSQNQLTDDEKRDIIKEDEADEETLIRKIDDEEAKLEDLKQEFKKVVGEDYTISDAFGGIEEFVNKGYADASILDIAKEIEAKIKSAEQKITDYEKQLKPIKAQKYLANHPNGIAGTSDFDTLEDYLDNVHGIKMDTSVKNLDFEAVKDAITGVEKIIAEFPDVGNNLVKIETSSNGVMSCTGTKITFNSGYFNDSQQLLNICSQQSLSGSWHPNSSIESIGIHEAAHGVEWVLDETNPAYVHGYQKHLAWHNCSEAKQIVSQACKNIKKTPYGKGKSKDELINGISKYASKDDSEALAEAFADVGANGANANPLSVEIKRLTKIQMKKYKGVI